MFKLVMIYDHGLLDEESCGAVTAQTLEDWVIKSKSQMYRLDAFAHGLLVCKISYDAVSAQPPAMLEDVVKLLQVPASQLRTHLEQMQKEGQDKGNEVCCKVPSSMT